MIVIMFLYVNIIVYFQKRSVNPLIAYLISNHQNLFVISLAPNSAPSSVGYQ